MIGSYICALWCTIVFGSIFGGMFKSMIHDKDDLQVLGVIFLVTLVGPAIAGLSMAVGLRRKGRATPMVVLAALIWNCVILGGFLLLDLIGLING